MRECVNAWVIQILATQKNVGIFNFPPSILHFQFSIPFTSQPETLVAQKRWVKTAPKKIRYLWNNNAWMLE